MNGATVLSYAQLNICFGCCARLKVQLLLPEFCHVRHLMHEVYKAFRADNPNQLYAKDPPPPPPPRAARF